MANVYRDCIACEKEFYITDKDQDFYASREMTLPKRCYDCRKQRRTQKEEIKAQQASQAPVVEEFFVSSSHEFPDPPEEQPRRRRQKPERKTRD